MGGGIFNALLHPRVAGKFTTTTGRQRVSVAKVGRGRKGSAGGKKASGPTRSELAMVGQVEAGNIYTSDGGKTWSVLGSKTPGTATKAVARAEKDHLLGPPGKGSNRPFLTPAGAAAFKKSGRTLPTARAPKIAQAAARKQATAAKHAAAAQKRAQSAAKRAATAQARTAKAATPKPIRGMTTSQLRVRKTGRR